MHPVPPTPTVKSATTPARTPAAQLALAFLMGGVAALLGMRVWQNRQTRPLESVPWSYSHRIDLNSAPMSELAQLPRVGQITANHIVAARPIASIDDLARLRGVGPVTREKLAPHITFGSTAAMDSTRVVKKAPADGAMIDPNRATLVELQLLPGIGPKMAQRIIDERGKRPFATIDELRRVAGIGPKTLEKLRGHLQIVMPGQDVTSRPAPQF